MSRLLCYKRMLVVLILGILCATLLPREARSAPTKSIAQPGLAATKSGAESGEHKKVEVTKKTEVAMFAAGCFWGVEETFREQPGVVSTEVGYCGGSFKNPTYADVCTKTTGHAETVRLRYDPAKISYAKLLDVFFANHNPTTVDRQGPDVGPNYRSVVFYTSAEQEAEAKAAKERWEKSGKYHAPIVTQIVPAAEFYRAEEYHQQYLEKRGEKACH